MAPPSPLVLPGPGYRVYVWKVKFGSVVRMGETVAVSVMVSSTSDGSATTATPAAKPAHKRPQRRPKVNGKSNVIDLSDSKPASAPVTAPAKPKKRLLSSLTAGVRTTGAILDSTSVAAPPTKNTAKKIEKSTETTGPVPIKANADGILTKPDQISEKGEADPTIVAYIVPCKHPAVLEKMCVVCGMEIEEIDEDAEGDDESMSAIAPSSSTSKTDKMTVSGGLTMMVSESERRDMSYQTQQRLWSQRKLNLVLDLDHTLVHATPDKRAHDYYSGNSGANEKKKQSDVYALSLRLPPEVVTVKSPKKSYHFVKLRPHAADFLTTLMPLYELSVYTAGTRDYAHEIVNMLCRHAVGATHDGPMLEDLRVQVSNLETMYAKKRSQKRSREEGDDEKDGDASVPPAKKKSTEDGKGRKKVVGFATTVTSNDDEMTTLKDSKPSSPTLEELTAIRRKLEKALEMENKAMELRKKLFGSRIVSRTDVGDLGRDVKSLARVFPGGGDMAAVVDDREDVWANATAATSSTGEPPANLLLVKPYHFTPFAGFADVNNAAGADLSKVADEAEADSESDQQLLWTRDTLLELHKQYYLPESRANRDTVPEILSKMRRRILKGSKILLSGIVPLHLQQRSEEAKVRKRAPMIRYLETLGAKQVELSSDATHVVAANAGTAKAQAARASNFSIALVKPSWLMECFWSVTKRSIQNHVFDSKDYIPKMDDLGGGNQSDESSDDDMDDEFASQLEDEML